MVVFGWGGRRLGLVPETMESSVPETMEAECRGSCVERERELRRERRAEGGSKPRSPFEEREREASVS